MQAGTSRCRIFLESWTSPGHHKSGRPGERSANKGTRRGVEAGNIGFVKVNGAAASRSVPLPGLSPSTCRFFDGDFVLAYTLDWAKEVNLLEQLPRLESYLENMYTRPHAPMRIKEAFARLRQ